MSCLGVHFALSESEVAALHAIADEQDRLAHIQEVIEEDYFSNHKDLMAESDKAWDAMHRTLADGELTWDGGEYPLDHVILAGELLYTESDYIVSLKTPKQVQDIAGAIPAITEDEFRKRYLRIDPDSYGMDLSDDDFSYTWDYFQSVRDLYLTAQPKGDMCCSRPLNSEIRNDNCRTPPTVSSSPAAPTKGNSHASINGIFVVWFDRSDGGRSRGEADGGAERPR